MGQILKNGAVLFSSTGQLCTVKNLIGSGGQGEVYEVEISRKSYALKWYYKEQVTSNQKELIEKLVVKGTPDTRFLWPLDIVDGAQNRNFGYIMPLRKRNFYSISDMMKRICEPTFRNLCTAAVNLTDSFLNLHSKGFCYRDISFSNIFLDPNNGDVLICDNDNVDVTGTTSSGVIGTPRFMSPEIVKGAAKPSTETDLFSLSVLLFYMFMMNHPLEGKKEYDMKCLDLQCMKRLYGEEPVFIWHPSDVSNRPVLGYQDNAIIYWHLYPEFIKNLFVIAFTDGIESCNKRILEVQWREAFIKLRDSIIYCGNCGMESFYKVENIKNKEKHICWACKKEIQTPPRIKIGNYVIMLNRDTKIYEHHIKNNLNFTKVEAMVVQNPLKPNLWGIKNFSSTSWRVITADGSIKIVESGRSVSIAVGIKIDFGCVQGEIRA